MLTLRVSSAATQVLQQTTAFFVGDPITQKWSIGGFSPKTAALGGLLSFLGQESGIGYVLCFFGLRWRALLTAPRRQYGHLKSEGDASITRGDFTGVDGMRENSDSYPKFFAELLAVGAKNSNGNVSPRQRFLVSLSKLIPCSPDHHGRPR